MPVIRGSGLITRGYNHTTIVSRGYGGIFERVAEAVRRGFYWGRSSLRHAGRKFEEVAISIAFMGVNDKKDVNIERNVRLTYESASKDSGASFAKFVSQQFAKVRDDIVISVTRMRRKGR